MNKYELSGIAQALDNIAVAIRYNADAQVKAAQIVAANDPNFGRRSTSSVPNPGIFGHDAA